MGFLFRRALIRMMLGGVRIARLLPLEADRAAESAAVPVPVRATARRR